MLNNFVKKVLSLFILGIILRLLMSNLGYFIALPYVVIFGVLHFIFEYFNNSFLIFSGQNISNNEIKQVIHVLEKKGINNTGTFLNGLGINNPTNTFTSINSPITSLLSEAEKLERDKKITEHKYFAEEFWNFCKKHRNKYELTMTELDYVMNKLNKAHLYGKPLDKIWKGVPSNLKDDFLKAWNNRNR